MGLQWSWINGQPLSKFASCKQLATSSTSELQWPWLNIPGLNMRFPLSRKTWSSISLAEGTSRTQSHTARWMRKKSLSRSRNTWSVCRSNAKGWGVGLGIDIHRFCAMSILRRPGWYALGMPNGELIRTVVANTRSKSNEIQVFTGWNGCRFETDQDLNCNMFRDK